MRQNIDIKEVLWSNHFIKSIGKSLKAWDITGTGRFDLEISNLQAQSCFHVESNVQKMTPGFLMRAFKIFEEKDLQQRLLIVALEGLRK